MDNLIEVLKSVAKAALLFLLGWLVVKSALPQIVALARSPELPVPGDRRADVEPDASS